MQESIVSEAMSEDIGVSSEKKPEDNEVQREGGRSEVTFTADEKFEILEKGPASVSEAISMAADDQALFVGEIHTNSVSEGVSVAADQNLVIESQSVEVSYGVTAIEEVPKILDN